VDTRDPYPGSKAIGAWNWTNHKVPRSWMSGSTPQLSHTPLWPAQG